MRTLIIIVLSIIVFPTFGQKLAQWDIDSIGTLMATELLVNERTKEVFIFNSGCIGCEVINDQCSCFGGDSITYLIWKENNKVWLTELNCCAEAQTRELNDSKIWNEFTSNKERIFKSKFKEDYITVHNQYWYLKVLPTFPTELRIYDYYFEEDHKFQAHNKMQYANEFRKILQKSIRENNE